MPTTPDRRRPFRTIEFTGTPNVTLTYHKEDVTINSTGVVTERQPDEFMFYPWHRISSVRTYWADAKTSDQEYFEGGVDPS